MTRDISGEKFGRLTAIRRHGVNNTGKKALWLCLCDCGKEFVVLRNSLVTGRTRSCGCLHRAGNPGRTHGFSGERLHRIWKCMRTRCNNPNIKDARWYFKKGITLFDDWNDYPKFREWAMMNGYADGLVIDRVNSDLGYSPQNCEWVTRSENSKRAMRKKYAHLSICNA